MEKEDFWAAVRNKEEPSQQAIGTGAFRFALLFGTAVVALAMILAPALSERSDRAVAFRDGSDFDMIKTGSIPAAGQAQNRTYTIRKSVTQPMPGTECIIDSAGRTNENC